MKIFSVVLNNFTRDNRVLKENISFKKAGFEPLIVAMHEDGLKEFDEQEGIKIIRIKLKTKNWPRSFIFSAFKYFEFVYKAFKLSKNYDVIHCNDLETLAVGYFRKLINRKVRLVYDAHEYEIHRTQTAHHSRIWLNKQMEKFFINSADAVITVSDSIAEEYKKLYRIDRPHLIYNCPALSMSDEVEYDVFRDKFQLKANQKIFLYQGSFTKGRGVETIIRPFMQIKDNKNVVVFMGYGPYLNRVKEAEKRSKNIFYHEAVSINEIEKHSRSADWGLLTIENVSKSYNFSLPNKLFEYAMAEIPIIAFPTLEIKNKINEFKIGFCAENESVDSLIDAIYKASKIDKSQFKSGLKLIKREFNWEKQEEKLINIYKNL